MTQAIHVKLLPHSANPARFHEHIDAGIERTADGDLLIAYSIHGLNIDLHVPGPHAPAPQEALWQTTCCELFLGPLGRSSYREFNFSPSGQWAAYDFDDIRQRSPQPADLPAPRIDFARSEDLMTLSVALPHTALPSAAALRIAVSVILQANDSHYGYWALTHPGARPDFHHPAGFVLRHDTRGFHA